MTTDEFGNEIEDESPDEKPQWRKDLERDARTGKEALARAVKAERALAIAQAGIDLSTPMGKLFAETYSGEGTVEAVKAKATELQMFAPETPAQSPEQVAEQAAYEKFDATGVHSGDSQTEFDRALNGIKSISPFGADGQLDPLGPQKLLAELAKHNVTIREESPTGGMIPLGTHIAI